jgi:hypothetical protein
MRFRDVDSNCHLGRLTLVGLRAQRMTDYPFPAANISLHRCWSGQRHKEAALVGTFREHGGLILLDSRDIADETLCDQLTGRVKGTLSMIDRRKLLLAWAATAAGAFFAPRARAVTGSPSCPWPTPAWTANGFPSHRWVNILFVHTGEHFKDRYFWDGAYSMDAVQRFSWTCRDFRANEAKLIDPRLMDLLFVLHWRYCKDEIKILSGYRSPQTNAQLEGAALNSQHIQARALDPPAQCRQRRGRPRFQDDRVWRGRDVPGPRIQPY